MKQTVEESAMNFANYESNNLDKLPFKVKNIVDYDNGLTRGFKAGADWQSKQSPWISVKERLPEIEQDVLAAHEYRGDVIVDTATFDGKYFQGEGLIFEKTERRITMGFTTPCFIRKNTLDIREKLEELGYYKNSPKWTDDCSIIWAYQYPVKGFDTPNYVIANAFDIPFDKYSALRGKFIDCGTNEELFLAIAALRDDTDKNQWFVLDHDNIWEAVGCYQYKGDFILCNSDQWCCGTDVPHAHKATVNELIEHFKEKE